MAQVKAWKLAAAMTDPGPGPVDPGPSGWKVRRARQRVATRSSAPIAERSPRQLPPGEASAWEEGKKRIGAGFRDRRRGGLFFRLRLEIRRARAFLLGRDAAFDHDIRRAADHDQVLDVVAADEHQAAARINGGGIEHRQPGCLFLPPRTKGEEGLLRISRSTAARHRRPIATAPAAIMNRLVLSPRIVSIIG